jgi:hypothetical protein
MPIDIEFGLDRQNKRLGFLTCTKYVDNLKEQLRNHTSWNHRLYVNRRNNKRTTIISSPEELIWKSEIEC